MLKICCMSVWGPLILIECLLSVVYYRDIVYGCPKIPDNLTNVMIYILLISGCISLAVTAYCCFSTVHVVKLIHNLWPEI